MLSIAAGGARRPELISEAEAKSGEGEELDFDSQVFDGFAPSEGAPGPEQAPLWEDVEQNEADIAAALHLELAELRALRTPVPTRPSGMLHVSGASSLLPGEQEQEEEVGVTNPVRKITGEIEAQDDLDSDLARTMQTPRPVLEPPVLEPPPARQPPAAPAKPAQSGSPVGAGYLARYPAHHGASKLPWLLVTLLGMAVLGLVAYIVMQ
jgi:hypothetical protein